MPNPSIIVNGKTRFLGCLPPKPNFGGLPKFLSAPDARIIPRDQWKPVDFRSLGVPILDQGNHGSCVGHGSTTGFWYKWLMDGGTVPPSGFSPTSLYAMINGGWDQGAIVSDALTSLQRDGVCTMAEFPESMIYQRQLTDAAKETRKRFKLNAAYHLSTFDEIGSGVQLGYTAPFGITIRSGFNNPGADGFIEPGGRALGGHCMCVVGMIQRNGKWVFIVVNSWGDWGANGCCLLGEEHFSGSDTDAFAVGSVLPDPQDPFRSPVVA